MLAVYAPVVRESTISFEYEVPSVEEFTTRIEHVSDGYPWLVCERENEILGYSYAAGYRNRAAYQWSVETSVYTHSEFRRKGIARALYQALIGLLRLQNFHTAMACIALPDPSSVALHESLGFTPVGLFRQVGYKSDAWCDVGWWQLFLDPDSKSNEPPQVRSVNLIRSDPAVTELFDSAARCVLL